MFQLDPPLQQLILSHFYFGSLMAEGVIAKAVWTLPYSVHWITLPVGIIIANKTALGIIAEP